MYVGICTLQRALKEYRGLCFVEQYGGKDQLLFKLLLSYVGLLTVCIECRLDSFFFPRLICPCMMLMSLENFFRTRMLKVLGFQSALGTCLPGRGMLACISLILSFGDGHGEIRPRCHRINWSKAILNTAAGPIKCVCVCALCVVVFAVSSTVRVCLWRRSN